MSSPNWAVAFGISDDDLTDLKDQLQPGEDPLVWILSNGYIPSGDYISWARETYQVPSVKDEFFSIPADPVLWDALKNEFAWTSTFLPLAEWQGVLLIGCLQPPEFHFPLHTPHRFVLAPAHCLAHRYQELEPTAVVPVAVAAAVAAPASVAASVQVRQRPADEFLADSLPQAPDIDLHDPEGLVVSMPEQVDENLFVVPEGMAIEDLGKPVPATPDGFEAGSQLIDLDSLNFSDEDPMANAKKVDAPSIAVAPAPAVAPLMTAAPPHTPVVPPGPPAEFVVAPPTPLHEPTSNSSLAQKSTPPPAPRLSRAFVSSSEPAVPLATCASIDTLTSAVVAHVNSHFEHAMILMYENSQLKPLKWSELLLSVKGDDADPVPLDLPSVFRIAARTSLPYHGYVATNPTNQAFFNAFNRSVVPKHLTAMPVVINGQLTAMLVGLSMTAVDYKASLAAMEKISSDFATQLERLSGRSAPSVSAAA